LLLTASKAAKITQSRWRLRFGVLKGDACIAQRRGVALSLCLRLEHPDLAPHQRVALLLDVEEKVNRQVLHLPAMRMAAQAEVLAARCGLRLNTELEQELRNDAAKRLTPESLSGMDEFAHTYILSVMRRQRDGICTHAVDQFGLDGKQIHGLLLP